MSNPTGKPWWQSMGMIGGLTGIIVGAAQVYSAATGAQIDVDALTGIVSNGLQLLLGIAGAVGGLLSLYGRLKACLPIKKQVLPLPWAGQPTVIPNPNKE